MFENRRKVLIRTDASREIGAGHLMRMLALGQLLSDSGYEIHFLIISYDCPALDDLKKENFSLHYLDKKTKWDPVQDACALIDLAKEIRASWVAIDGYHFDSDYERKIKEAGFKLLRVDDTSSIHYYADVILNQNYGAEEMTYSTEPGSRILAGLKYVLIRKEFLRINGLTPAETVRDNDGVHVLISLGSSVKNTDDLNFKLVQCLLNSCKDNVSITMIKDNLSSGAEKRIKDISEDIEIITKRKNIAEEMVKTDLAIVSAGATMWELIFMRVPFCAVSLTDAQKDYLPAISSEGLCVDLGWHEDLTYELTCEKLRRFFNDKTYRERIKSKIEDVIDRNRIGADLIEFLGENI